ncbi:hypothetical protein CVT24_000200 [Panaeolus cyanescens]|uniref:GPI transamidase component PIG-T n=1 Tax=Panaeolus cyanescens TaxID=181874 RepID=A0A409VIP2_9AGAR|nr:hypothetical protein CVT24_000200 [Panaeolus cyanescens]
MPPLRVFLWPLTLLHLLTVALAANTETFNERLSLNSLQDGKVAAKFTFTTLLKDGKPRDPRLLEREDESQHFTIFPLALGQILRQYGVTELHLNLNAGKWNYDVWGSPEEKGVGTGGELWAWLADGANTSIDERWKGLRNALAGLFCASLGSLDELRTTIPSRAFSPEGSLPHWDLPHHIRHGSLPSENVCTENLTPFLKLLPCKSLSGIASLLNPHRLFDADWHGMGVHVLWREDEGIEVRLTFQSVFDPLRFSNGRIQDWSLKSLFNRQVERACPVAESSEILVGLPHAIYSIKPEPSSIRHKSAVFDVNTLEKPLDVSLHWRNPFQYPLVYATPSTPISIRRTLTGSSQAWGQLSVAVTNNREDPLSIIYLETMPWLVQFFLHTLETRIDGALVDNVISNLTYTLPIPHSRPTTLQMLLTLPPKKTVYLTMEVTKAFLRYTEHPPDAERGWDLPPAIFTPVRFDNDTVVPLSDERMYSSVLLADLATPDFSMPYNVIMFTCSLIAFVFGTIHNALTRKLVVVPLTDDKAKENEKNTEGS